MAYGNRTDRYDAALNQAGSDPLDSTLAHLGRSGRRAATRRPNSDKRQSAFGFLGAARYGAGSNLELEITVSIRVASCRPRRQDGSFEALATDLLARADSALYRAKSCGRNRVEVSS